MAGTQPHTEVMDIPTEPIKQEVDNIDEEEIQYEVKFETQTEEIDVHDDNPFENVQLQVKQEEISLTIERETTDSQSDGTIETINDEYNPKDEQYITRPKFEAGCDEKSEVKEETVLGDSLVTYDYPSVEDNDDDDDAGELDSSMDSNDAAALTRVEACLQDELGIKNEDSIFEVIVLAIFFDCTTDGFFIHTLVISINYQIAQTNCHISIEERGLLTQVFLYLKGCLNDFFRICNLLLK